MELFATGFNAWDQLRFDDDNLSTDEPDDIHEFAVVLKRDKITKVESRLSYTKINADDKILRAGAAHNARDHDGNHENTVYAQDGKGEYLVAEIVNPDLSTADGRIGAGRLAKYASYIDWRAGNAATTWPCKEKVGIKQVVAYNAGFAILFDDGTVATAGDPRFEDCLGRPVTLDCPADSPHQVLDLDDLQDDPVKHVAAGGYTVAALTYSGSLYAWGMPSVGTQRRQSAFVDLSGTPNYIEVAGGKDVQDVAVGEPHAIVLTTDGCVYVLGGNENGQLGLGKNCGNFVEDWTEVKPHGISDGHRVVSVAAGPRCSFLITSNSNG